MKGGINMWVGRSKGIRKQIPDSSQGKKLWSDTSKEHEHDWHLCKEQLGNNISKLWITCTTCWFKGETTYIVESKFSNNDGVITCYTEEEWKVIGEKLMTVERFRYEANRSREQHSKMTCADKVTGTSYGYVSDEAIINIVIQDGKVPTILVNGKDMPVAKCTYNYVTSDSRSQGIMHITADVLDIKGNVIHIDKDISNEADR